MVFQILLVDDLVDEACRARPVVFGQRVGEGDVEREVVVLGGQLLELVSVEELLQRAASIPEGGLARCVFDFELVEDVRTHGGHARATADEHHLPVGVLHEELSVRA